MNKKLESTTLKELAEFSMREDCKSCPFEKLECSCICVFAKSIMCEIENSKKESRK